MALQQLPNYQRTRLIYGDSKGSGLLMVSEVVQGAFSPKKTVVAGRLTDAARTADSELVLIAGARIRSLDSNILYESNGSTWFSLGTATNDDGTLSSLQIAALNTGMLLDSDGALLASSELAPGIVTLSAAGAVRNGAGEFAGFKVRALTGTVNVVLYDALSATGTPIDTRNAISLTGGDGAGYYAWAGNKVRPLTTGLFLVVSGGGTFTIDFLVGA